MKHRLKAMAQRINIDSDGCTGVPDFDTKDCCQEHDYYYRNDISVTGCSRAESDKRLLRCLSRKCRVPFVPLLYYIGARLFGWIPWNKQQKRMDTDRVPKVNTPKPPHMVRKKPRHIPKSQRYIEEDYGEWYS